MFGPQVIYTANGDLTTLRAIFDSIAMFCASGDPQRTMIFSFALAAAVWHIVSMTTAAAVNAGSGTAGGELGKKAIGTLIPFVLALMLTEPALKEDVTVESGLTGATTTISNVPVVISFLPATASLISKIVGEKLETAMQGTGTDYSSLSATGHGFINPLKTLLTSRTAILKLGGIASEINSLVSTCLGSDSGVDYAMIANRVMFAGNLPAATAGPTSISVWSGVGSERTSIGMLLAEAAANEDAIVTDIKVGTNDVATCADAAAQVGADIEAALTSDDFKRVVQGAVNSADQPNAGAANTITALAASYEAARTASVTGALAGGTAQANAETINLLFSELVKNDLDCLRADGANKSTCLAMAVQGNEIERNNIQSAANGFESLMYAGAFANQITAVIIGLGPVIIMFMMWSGVNAGRNIKVAAHMVVWPLLIMNVGAELINGMTYISVSNFLNAIASGGVINQSTAVEAYKHFSLEIGTSSHLMATLPILMSTIFALGQSAALVKISDSMTSGSKDEGKATSPAPVDSVPLVTNSSVAKAEQGIGIADVAMTGAIPAMAMSAQFGSAQREASNNISYAHQKMQSISEGETDMQAWTKAFSTGDYKKLGVTESTFKALRDEYSRNYSAIQAGKSGQGVNSSKDNFNASQTSAAVGAELKVGTPGGGAGLFGAQASVSANTDHRTTTGASDNLQAGKKVEQDASVAKSQALANTFSTALQSDKFKNIGTDESRTLQHSLGVQRQYAKTLSESKSVSDVAAEAVKKSSGYVELNAQMGSKELLGQIKTNKDFRQYQLAAGRAFENLDAAKPWIEKAREDMQSGVTDRVVGDEFAPQANEALARHRAAVMLSTDENASWGDRLKAEEYLLGAGTAMLSSQLRSATINRPNEEIASPTNRSGVNAAAVIRQVSPPAAKGGGRAAKGAKHEPSTAEKLNKGYDFATDVAHGVETVSKSVLADRQAGEHAAAEAGLTGSDGPGTNHRAMSNVGANVTGNKGRTELPTKK
jgi:conjugal transfer mating pair stabilization protein TraG